MIQVTNIAKSFGDHSLFQDVTFTLGRGERVGLVGRNGTGKTTLFKILQGEEAADRGEVIVPKNYRLGSLKQHLTFKKDTILKECMTALGADEQFDDYKAEKALMGLGFKTSDFSRPPSDFSGGYQIRLNLAKVLLSDPDCLLLDEPTNYLDIVSMRWLSKFLRGYRGELVLITHDRGFMDEVTTHTMGIWRQRVMKVPGDTGKYYEKIVLDEEIHEKTRVNQEKKRKELEGFVSRFSAKASKASQAQSRLKMLEKMEQISELETVSSLDFNFNHKECPGKVLVEAKDLTFGYGEEPLFQDLNFTITKGDKLAIIGKNGKGKSTLLNVLAGELEPWQGDVNKNVNLLSGHFGQTNINRLNLEASIEEEIRSADPDLPRQRIRQICGTMMFPGELAEKKIKVLSGGERARVLLGKLLVRPTNLLLLDEPTNHLDQESIDALTYELQNYPGAVIIVTHSEMILRDVAEKLIVFHQDRAEFLAQTYDDFLAKTGWEEESAAGPQRSEKVNRNEVKRLRQEIILERSRVLGPLKKKMDKLETEVIDLEAEQTRLEAELIELAAKGESKKIQEFSQRLGTVKVCTEASFEALTTLSEEHDKLFEEFEVRLKGLS